MIGAIKSESIIRPIWGTNYMTMGFMEAHFHIFILKLLSVRLSSRDVTVTIRGEYYSLQVIRSHGQLHNTEHTSATETQRQRSEYFTTTEMQKFLRQSVPIKIIKSKKLFQQIGHHDDEIRMIFASGQFWLYISFFSKLWYYS